MKVIDEQAVKYEIHWQEKMFLRNKRTLLQI